MCGGRSLGLSICDFGVLLVSSQFGGFIQHVQIHLFISILSKDASSQSHHIVDDGEVVFMLVIPDVAVWVSDFSHLIP